MTKLFDLPTTAPHPAKYTVALLPTFARMLQGYTKILDPFGWTGKIFELLKFLPTAKISAIEIEPEWAVVNPRVEVGNAINLRWPDGHFDAICTSPTYGNRMADGLIDGTERITYASKLGRKLSQDNTGSYMQVYVTKKAPQFGGLF